MIKIAKKNGQYRISRSEWKRIGREAGWWDGLKDLKEKTVQQYQKRIKPYTDPAIQTVRDVRDSLPHDPNVNIFDLNPNPNIDPKTGYRKDDPRNPSVDRNDSTVKNESGSGPYTAFTDPKTYNNIKPLDKIKFKQFGRDYEATVQVKDKDTLRVTRDDKKGEWETLNLNNKNLQIEKLT